VDKEGDPRGLIPQRELFPVGLLANMEAVIAPENNNGVVLHAGCSIERVEESSQLMVHVGNAGKVSLHQLSPLVIFDHPFVPVGATVVMSVVQVIFAVRRPFNFLKRILVKPLAGNLPGDVGAKKPYGEEERFFALLLHLFDGPVDNHMVTGLFVGLLEGRGSEELRAATQWTPLGEAGLFVGY